jgi:hypothetical protein
VQAEQQPPRVPERGKRFAPRAQRAAPPNALARLRALHREHREVASGLQRNAGREAIALPFDPRQVLVRGPGVDHHAEAVLAAPIHDQVVEHPAVFVQHARVQRFPRQAELAHVVGEQPAEEGAGRAARQVDRQHVRDVEHARVAPHAMVLLDLRAVVQRHLPAAKVGEAGVRAPVGVEQRGAFQLGRVHRSRAQAKKRYRR